MAVDKFTFISPGIFLSEVDESQNPIAPELVGPCIIGRTAKGPAMRPVKVSSYAEFADMFGDPHAGGPVGGDTWRSGDFTGPTYAAYAAKAWLASSPAPATIVRTLGADNDNATSTTSGWTTTMDPDGFWEANGGAFGLWTIDSGAVSTHNTGTLAAVFYVPSGSMMLISGTTRQAFDRGGPNDGHPTASSGALIKSTANDNEFHLQLWHLNALQYDFGKVNFDRTSPRWIRNVLSTTPSLTNSTVSDTSSYAAHEDKYWLGETFERYVAETTDSDTRQWGVMLPLMSGTIAGADVAGWHDRQNSFVNAETGWFFSQDFGVNTSFDAGATTTRLFKLHALDYGAWPNRSIKIGIEDIRAGTTPTSPWGSFTIAIYKSSTYDTRAKEEALERFTNCSLDPTSPNYVAYKIGDQFLSWSDENKIHTEVGEYANKSKYVRIEMNPVVKDGGINQASLPFGFTGPLRPVGFSYLENEGGAEDQVTSGSLVLGAFGAPTAPTVPTVPSRGYITGTAASAPGFFNGPYGTGSFAIFTGQPQFLSGGFTGSWKWPAVGLRSASNDAGTDLGTKAYFGVHGLESKTSTTYDQGYGEYNIDIPFYSGDGGRFDTLSGVPDNNVEYMWIFSLDEISGNVSPFVHKSGSRAQSSAVNQSLTAVDNSYKSVLDKGVRQFWAPMYGGHDGLDITESEPFRNSAWSSSTTKLNNSDFNTIYRAVTTVEDSEAVEYNLLTVPGITNTALTDLVMTTCAERTDALAIVDLEGIFTPSTENTSDFATNLGSVATTVSNIQGRNLDNSYACAYYPWVQIRDTKSDRLVYVPPSVVALGTFGHSEAVSELWFAPAGFNRGGLTHGAGGVPVVGVSERLTSKKRDDLYENNINPIAKFPSEGIVIFGQKTLQQTSSALDRINVRRLMIFVKKEISRISSTILFDQNISVTWGRFTGEVEPLLSSIRSRYGLTDFKVVLDETTTTPDLIDRNVLYAKIFLKPARSIEYIAVDFIITRTGAAFED